MRRAVILSLLAGTVVLAGAAVVTALQQVGVARGYAPPQPIDFSHALHSGRYEIACLYCHYGAERSRHAGIPPLAVCMNCHSQLAVQTREVAKLKEAVAQSRPIVWIKVHNLPDFVYFNHSEHVLAGVACQSCHGPVEAMERVRQESSLTMGWCLDCHRQRGITEFSARPAGEERRASSPVGGQDCSKCHY